jgi:hypothetical protein
MRRILGRLAGFLLSTAVLSVGMAGCVATSNDAGGELSETTAALQAAFPASRSDVTPGGVARTYGPSLATGAAPDQAAEHFRQSYSAAVGVGPNDLVPQGAPAGTGKPGAKAAGIGLMYDQRTGQPKFWLYPYRQTANGVPVHAGGLLTLVRNDPSNAVVWAASTIKDLGNLRVASGSRPTAPDRAKSLAAIRGTTDLTGRLLGAPASLAALSAPELVVFAGTEDRKLPARMAMRYVAEASPASKWLMIADATTGDVLYLESLVVYDDVSGNVTANVTQGDTAMECASELEVPFPFAEVDGPSPEVAFSDANGAYTLSNGVTGPIGVSSLMGGQFFDVVNYAGSLEVLSSSVVPPATASFLHNASDSDPQVIAQVNGYANANQMRAFLLKYLPTYPVISTQINFPVNVNLSSANTSTCPGNAFYNGSSINFCLGSSSYTNTSFASVSHHEYGHHMISSGGSGQGEYGEGMADTVAVLQSGEHGLAYGFYLNQCTQPLRDADNTCQFASGSCSSCGSEIHACGQLISGTIWSIRKALAVSNPNTYVDLINNLVLSSILLHKGTAINSQIAIDLLTLDDDDGNLNNGAPHYNEICSGFTAHGMTCPPILTGLSVTPAGNLSSEGQIGGPFAPESVVYTLSNLGPSATLSYQVAASAAAPWLSIANATGQLAIGQTAQVTVAIDQAAAAGLVAGGYDTTLQFTNLTDGVGNTSRSAHLQVGVAPAIFSETFEGGLGGFSTAPSATNLWHVSSSCVSTQPGHSTPNSLYFGVDSGCTFSAGAAVSGAATSQSIQITDTSVAKLRFNYYLQTEHISSYDKASVQVSINNAPFTIAASNSQGGIALQETTAWTPVEVDLAPLLAGLAAPVVRVRVAFDSIDSVANNYTGFVVDDVRVLAFAGGVINTAPVVNAGFDQTITLPATVSLGGVVTDDALPNPPATVTTVWSQVSGPGTVTFGNPSAKATTAAFSSAGSYVLRLTASDSLLSASDDVVITVNPVPNLGMSVTPAGNLASEGPVGGPFAPTSIVYTVTNLGSNASMAYQVSTVAPTTWLTITNGSGQLAINQSAQVTVAVNSGAAAALALGGYDAAIQIANLTDGLGNTTRSAHLQVGVPVPFFTEAFETGLGSFSLGAEAQNLWHVSASCTSTQPGHTTPNSLYFGIDSSCNFSNSNIVAGTATSTPIAIADTSLVKLRVSYVLGTENSTYYDKASVQVSVNGGAFTVVASNNQGGVKLQETTTWTTAEADLTALVAGLSAPSIRVRVAFDSVDTVANTNAGFLVDDIKVLGPPNNGPPNAAPVVKAGLDQTVTLPAMASLGGSVTDDGLPNPPGATTATWSMLSGPGAVTFGNANAALTTATFSIAGSYVLRLSASDSALSAVDDVAINVNPANTAPAVNAGPDQTVSIALSANLNGTVIDDGYPNPPATVTTTWSKVSGPGTVTFGSASAKVTTAKFSATGSYVLRLTATDSALSASDDIAISVVSNTAPLVNAGPDQTITLPSTASLSGTVTDDGRPTFPGSVSTTWSKVSGPGTVTFGSASAKATTATFSVAGNYVLRLTGNDGALSATDDIAITVNAAQTAPVVNAGADQTITLPADANLNGTVTDDGKPNPPAVVTTTWSKVSGPGTVTFANPSAKQTPATFSVAGSYVLRLTASDSALSASDDIAITVKPALTPCTNICSNPINFTINGTYQSGSLGLGSGCYQTASVVHGGTCANFILGRTLKVNNTSEPCNNASWPSVPAAVNGGYCFQVSLGSLSSASFTAF